MAADTCEGEKKGQRERVTSFFNESLSLLEMKCGRDWGTRPDLSDVIEQGHCSFFYSLAIFLLALT